MISSTRQGKDNILLTALACGASPETAAARAGVSLRTVFRRLADPDFQQAFQKHLREMMERSFGMLSAASGEAVKTMVELNKNHPSGSVRLGAARTIIESQLKLAEMMRVEERLEHVERSLQELKA